MADKEIIKLAILYLLLNGFLAGNLFIFDIFKFLKLFKKFKFRI